MTDIEEEHKQPKKNGYRTEAEKPKKRTRSTVKTKPLLESDEELYRSPPRK